MVSTSVVELVRVEASSEHPMQKELTKDSQANVDAKISTAAALEENTDGREDDGEQDFL